MAPLIASRHLPSSIEHLWPSQQVVATALQSFFGESAETKALGLWGPSGCGKSMVLHLIAEECEIELVYARHLGAIEGLSKHRDRDLMDVVVQVVGGEMKREKKKRSKCIVLDDPYIVKDNKTVKTVMTTAKLPVIFLTDNPAIFRRIRGITVIAMKAPTKTMLLPFFHDIAKKEGIPLSKRQVRMGIGEGEDIRAVFQWLDVLQLNPKDDEGSARRKDDEGSAGTKDLAQKNPSQVADALLRGKSKTLREIDVLQTAVTPFLHKSYPKKMKGDMEKTAGIAELFSLVDARLRMESNPFGQWEYFHHVLHYGISSCISSMQ